MAREPDRTARRHHRHEGERQGPERTSADLRRKQAYGHHGEHVVGAAEWMGEAMREAGRVLDPSMGQSRTARGRQGEHRQERRTQHSGDLP